MPDSTLVTAAQLADAQANETMETMGVRLQLKLNPPIND